MVIQILDHALNPMAVDEIFFDMKKKDNTINLSTVYRTMETLLKKNLIVKTTRLDDNRSRYEYNRMEHKHHLVCTRCNRMISVEGCPVEEYVKSLCSKTGFKQTGHRLEIYGVCPACRNA